MTKTLSLKAGALTAVVILLGALALFSYASADSTTTDFESFTLGTVNAQDGWTSTGAAGSGCAIYDHAVVSNSYGFAEFGSKVLRISNAVTSGCFGDMTFSKSLIDESGEVDSTSGGMSGGTRQAHFEAQFDFASTESTQQPGLFVSVSPDRGDGSRMSYLGFSDELGGIDVIFYDTPGTGNPATFSPTTVATGLSRDTTHTAKFVIDYVDGASNDVVKIYIDGVLVHTGTTWENYFRFDSEASAEQSPRTTDDLIFRTGGGAAPGTAGKGFLFDNVSLMSGPTPPPACDNPVTQTFVSDTTETVVVVGGSPAVSVTPHTAWTASIPGSTTWIWETGPTAVDEVVAFERSFTVVGTVLSATLDIAADNSYKVFIDGVEVAADAAANNFQLATQDSYNLTADVTPGTHTLRIEVKNHGTFNASSNPAGLLYKFEVETCNDPIPPPANACETPGVAPAGYTLQNGTAGHDKVTLASMTMFVGLGGNDKVTGGDGNYIVCLGAGNDKVTLGDGDVVVDAGAGNDKVTLGDGGGTLISMFGNNTIIAGDGGYTVTVGAGNDKITTGSGADTIDAGDGNNKVNAGGGDDSITALGGNDKINGEGGTDTCAPGAGFNVLTNCEL